MRLTDRWMLLARLAAMMTRLGVLRVGQLVIQTTALGKCLHFLLWRICLHCICPRMLIPQSACFSLSVPFTTPLTSLTFHPEWPCQVNQVPSLPLRCCCTTDLSFDRRRCHLFRRQGGLGLGKHAACVQGALDEILFSICIGAN